MNHLWIVGRLLLLTCLALLLSGFARAAPPADSTVTLNVHLVEMEPAEGYAFIAVYADEDSFLDWPRAAIVDSGFFEGGEYHVTFEGLPPGEYAVTAFHDLNQNYRLDKNWLGIPNEPYGFTNDYIPRGIPSFRKAASILLPGDTTLVVPVR